MRVISSFAAASLLLAGVPSAANAAGNPGANRDYVQEVQQVCRELIEAGTFPKMNFGECVSFDVTSVDGFKAHYCDAALEIGFLEDLGFEDYNDCVRNLFN